MVPKQIHKNQATFNIANTMFALNHFFLLTILFWCLKTKYSWIYIFKYYEEIKHILLPETPCPSVRWSLTFFTPSNACYIFTCLISLPLKLLKNDEMWNWDHLPIHSEPKLKVPRLFILPVREMEEMGEGGENWEESLGK